MVTKMVSKGPGHRLDLIGLNQTKNDVPYKVSFDNSWNINNLLL